MTQKKPIRKKSKKKLRNIFKIDVKENPIVLWIYLALAIVILYVLIYVVPSITGALKTTYVAEYGEVEIGDETDIYIARDEQIYLSSTTGTIKVYPEEGDLVKKGSTIAKVTPSNSQGSNEQAASKYTGLLLKNDKKTLLTETGGYCQKTGVYSGFIDGYEKLLSPKNMTKVSASDLAKISEKDLVETPTRKITKGEPMFKVASNAKWYILFMLPNKEAEKYDGESDFKVIIGEDEEDQDLIYSYLYKKVKKGNKTLVILQTNRYYENYTKLRTCKAKIIRDTASGIFITKSSVREKDGKKGVMVKNTLGEFEFKPIKIITTKEDMYVVEKSYYYDDKGEYVETVSTYDQVLK